VDLGVIHAVDRTQRAAAAMNVYRRTRIVILAPFGRFDLRDGVVPSTWPLATPRPFTRLTTDRQPAFESFVFASAGSRPRTFGTLQSLGTTRDIGGAFVVPAALEPPAEQVTRLPRSAFVIL
jgi:hypothetical protein